MALTSAASLPVCRLVALTLALAAAASSARKIPPSLTPISRDLYHSSDSILREIKALVARNSDRLTMDTVRASNKGYSAEMFVVTFNHAKETVDDGSKIKIMLSFGQHGRELITSEVALSLLYILTEKRRIAGVDLSSFEKILENLVIKVVPMENFNGRKRVEAGELCDRRNGRGVDLNRNWSVDWGKKEKRVINKCCMAFLILFEEGLRILHWITGSPWEERYWRETQMKRAAVRIEDLKASISECKS